jgi:hypothetical protein
MSVNISMKMLTTLTLILGVAASYYYRKEILIAMSLTKEKLMKVIQIAKESLASKQELTAQVDTLTKERDGLKTENETLKSESALVSDAEVVAGVDEVIGLAEPKPEPVEVQEIDADGNPVFDEAGNPVIKKEEAPVVETEETPVQPESPFFRRNE